MKKFRFSINATSVNPIWGDGRSRVTTREGQKYRTTIQGAFTFMREDFDLIDAAAFNTEFSFLIELDEGAGYQTYWEGYFYKKDCKITRNPNIITVEPKPDDRYRKILENLDKEFDLIQLSPKRHVLKYIKQGVLQVWTYPSNYMTNITRGNWWVRRVDITETDSVKLQERYKFGFKSPSGTELFVPGDATVLDPDVSGYYVYDTYERTDGAFRFIGVGSAPNSPILSSIYDDLPTDDPEGFCNLKLFLTATTLDDFADFGSTWSIFGGTYEFLGIRYRDETEEYEAYFRSVGSIQAPSGTSGIITHISGATNTANQSYTGWVYRERDDSDPDNINPYKHTQSGGGTVDVKDYIFFVRWAIYEDLAPTIYSYVYLTPTTGRLTGNGLTTYGEMDQEGPLFKTIVGTNDEQCRLVFNIFYQRILTDLEQVAGVDTEELDVDDVQNQEMGYKYAIPKEYDDFEVTDLHTLIETRYGKFNESAANWAGEYFEEFTSGNQTIPLNRPDWKEASVWMDLGAGKLSDIQAADDPRELRHTYKLSEIIKLLLVEINSNITFEENTDHSEFLFSATNPITGDPQPDIFITPKSNVLVGEYSQEATKAIIKLSEIIELLKVTHQLDWFIDDSNRLRIEHVRWFNNGGSYTTPQIGQDLTTQRIYKSNILAGYEQDIVEFEDQELPEIIRTSWMDNQSPAFDGFDLIATDDYVSKGTVKPLAVTRFSSDLDYMILEAANMNPDGFAVLAAFQNPISQEWTIPFKEVAILGNWKYNLQNGHLSFLYLQDKFYKDDSSSANLEINQQATTANSIKRTRIQTVKTPESGALDPMKLIKTIVDGTTKDGKIKSITEDLESDYLTIELEHETI